MKKNSGVMMAPDYMPQSRIALEGKHATALKKDKIGSKVKFTVHGTKKRHVMNADGSHSIDVDIDKVESPTEHNVPKM